MELKDERHQRSQLENEVLKFEKEVKRLQAEVHASSLQEEEANQRVIILVHQERSLRSEIQRLKTEVDSLQNRLVVCNQSMMGIC
jgi:chromosome segregation ATPase